MTVQVRGVTSALSATQTVPAGVVAGDLLVVVLRSFHTTSSAATPWSDVTGWTWRTNMLWGASAGAGLTGATWAVATGIKVATASEPAGYTFAQAGAEQIGGGMVALYSDTGQALTDYTSATNSGPSGQRFISFFDHGDWPGALTVHVLMGQGTAVSDYQGFTGTRTHHATLTWHSDTPYTDAPTPSGPPTYHEYDRDIVMSIDTEAGAITYGNRSVLSDFPALAGNVYWSNSWTTVYETGAPPVTAGWRTWIID